MEMFDWVFRCLKHQINQEKKKAERDTSDKSLAEIKYSAPSLEKLTNLRVNIRLQLGMRMAIEALATICDPDTSEDERQKAREKCKVGLSLIDTIALCICDNDGKVIRIYPKPTEVEGETNNGSNE